MSTFVGVMASIVAFTGAGCVGVGGTHPQVSAELRMYVRWHSFYQRMTCADHACLCVGYSSIHEWSDWPSFRRSTEA